MERTEIKTGELIVKDAAFGTKGISRRH